MAQEEKVNVPGQDDAKYQAFDVGPSGGEQRDKPKKRSTLLTVCPFILGEQLSGRALLPSPARTYLDMNVCRGRGMYAHLTSFHSSLFLCTTIGLTRVKRCGTIDGGQWQSGPFSADSDIVHCSNQRASLPQKFTYMQAMSYVNGWHTTGRLSSITDPQSFLKCL